MPFLQTPSVQEKLYLLSPAPYPFGLTQMLLFPSYLSSLALNEGSFNPHNQMGSLQFLEILCFVKSRGLEHNIQSTG